MTERNKQRGERQAVFVTGASSGIGAAIAQEFAHAGFTVGCVSRRATVPGTSASLVPIKLDVTDGPSTAKAIDDFVASQDNLAGVVNAAGFHASAPSDTLPLDDVRTTMETNFVSAIRIAQLAFPHLKEQGGFIANIGSFYANLGVSGSLAYSASKGALASATRCLAVEWATHRISVLNFAPGYVETELNADFLADTANRELISRKIPARRIAQPDEIARLVVAVLTSDCTFLTGETITIDGGQGIRL